MIVVLKFRYQFFLIFLAQIIFMACALSFVNSMVFIRARNFLLNIRSQSAQAKYRLDAKVLDVNALYLEIAIRKTLPVFWYRGSNI